MTGSCRGSGAFGGFTLVEVLVALAIVALVLITGLQTTQALTRASQRETEQWLAGLCAQNELVQLRLSKQMPGLGTRQTACRQAGRDWVVQTAVQPTPNVHFVRVDVRVQDPSASADWSLVQVSTVLGGY